MSDETTTTLNENEESEQAIVDKFNQLIKNLIDGLDDDSFTPHTEKADLTVDDFSGALLEGMESRQPDFWKYLITFMSNQYQPEYIGHSPIYGTDFPQSGQSFIEYLNNNIDLDKNINQWNNGIWEALREKYLNGDLDLWNESVGEIVGAVIQAFDEDGKIYIRGSKDDPSNAVYIDIRDLMKSNAGNKFYGIDDTTNWVRPNINVNNKTYGEVRGKDKILSVLNDSNELQFTNELGKSMYLKKVSDEILRVYAKYQIEESWEEALTELSDYSLLLFNYWGYTISQFEEDLEEEGVKIAQAFLIYSTNYPNAPEFFSQFKSLEDFFNQEAINEKVEALNPNYWIRLIMPKYLRKVEVEDLNRNFWVIGQNVSAICAFLFGPEAPFKKLFEDMLAEIVQLWENILYLWAAYALLSQKPEPTEIHFEILPLANSMTENYIKLDDFDNLGFDIENDFDDPTVMAALTEEIKNRCKAIVNQYSDRHVVILPKVRLNNYKHNYYSKECYPFVIFYNRYFNEYSIIPIYLYNTYDYSTGNFDTAIFDASNVNSFKSSFAVAESEFNYEFIPAQQIIDESGHNNVPYYILHRTKIVGEHPQFITYNTTNHRLTLETLWFFVYDVAAILKTCTDQNFNIQNCVVKSGYTQPVKETDQYAFLTIIESDENRNIDPQESYPITIPIEDIYKGYYQGEFPSWLAVWTGSSEVIPESREYKMEFDIVQLNPYSYHIDDILPLTKNLDSMSQNDVEAALKTGFERRNNESSTYIDGIYQGALMYSTNVYSDFDQAPNGNAPYQRDYTIPQNSLGIPTSLPTGWKYLKRDNQLYEAANNDYCKAIYNWDASNFAINMIKNQYLSGESSLSPQEQQRAINGELYTLYLYGKGNGGSGSSDVKAKLILGQHQVQVWRGWSSTPQHTNPTSWQDLPNLECPWYHMTHKKIKADSEPYKFFSLEMNNGQYQLVENDWGRTNSGTTTIINTDTNDIAYEVPNAIKATQPVIQYYDRCAQAISTKGAVLSTFFDENDPTNNTLILYDDFFNCVTIPYGFVLNSNNQNTNGVRELYEKNYVYYLLAPVNGYPSTHITDDNWIIIYVNVCGGWRPRNEFTKFTNTNLEKSPNERREGINGRITIHIFFPHGKYVRKIIDRYYDKGYQASDFNKTPVNDFDQNFNAVVWKVSYEGNFVDNETIFEEAYNNNANTTFLDRNASHIYQGEGYSSYYYVGTTDANRDYAKYPNTYEYEEEKKLLDANKVQFEMLQE